MSDEPHNHEPHNLEYTIKTLEGEVLKRPLTAQERAEFEKGWKEGVRRKAELDGEPDDRP